MNDKLICNTGPLVALSMIDRIDILRHLFARCACDIDRSLNNSLIDIRSGL